MAERYALLIGASEYNDEKLARLKTPAADLDILAGLLGEEDIGGYQVKILLNKPFLTVLREIASFLKDRHRDDLVLLYFSGHGVLDESGNLYLATQDTESDLLSATALSSKFIKDEMDRSRSKRQVLILDCCHSGAFLRGTKGAGPVLTQETFEGYGRAVLTASDSVQYALEGDQVSGDLELSLFTHFLAEGIQTGDADRDSDDWIELDEWFEYASRKVREHTHRQTPRKFVDNQYGELFIARNPKAGVIRPADLSQKLRARLKSDYVPDRLEAIEELKGWLESDDDSSVVAAQVALEHAAATDDSLTIRSRAIQTLASSAGRLAALKAKADRRNREQAGRLAALTAAEERWARQTAEDKEKATAQAAEEQRAREQVRLAAERLAAEKAEEGRLAKEREEQARLAAEQLAIRKAEEDRLAQEREKLVRIVAEKARLDAERLEKEKARAECLARDRERQAQQAAQKAKEERLAREREEQARRAAQKTRPERVARKELEKPPPKKPFKAPGLQATLSDHKETVSCLAFSPDGSRLASGSYPSDRPILGDQTIRVWRISDGSLLNKLNHRKGVYGLVFMPDGARLASAGEDGWVHLWEPSSGRVLWKRKGVQYPLTTALYSPDGSSVVIVDQPNVLVLNGADGSTLHELTLEEAGRGLINRHKPVISADGKIALSIDERYKPYVLRISPGLSSVQDTDAVVKEWRLTDGKQVGAFKLPVKPEPIYDPLRGRGRTTQSQSEQPEMGKPGAACFDLSPDGKVLAVGLENGQVFLMSIPAGNLLAVLGKSAGLPRFSLGGNKLQSIEFSPTQGFLVAAMAAELRYWSVPDGDLLHAQKVDYAPDHIVFSPTGKQFACTAGSDIKIWSFSP